MISFAVSPFRVSISSVIYDYYAHSSLSQSRRLKSSYIKNLGPHYDSCCINRYSGCFLVLSRLSLINISIRMKYFSCQELKA